MPHDPARLADTKAWPLKANQDLRAASHDLATNPSLAFDVVFHAQQAVEKVLKGFLAWHDRPFRKTHNIEELGEACINEAVEALTTAQAVSDAILARLPREAHPSAPGD